MTTASTEDAIKLRVDAVAPFFPTPGPFPFREQDLGEEAKECIVGWTQALPADKPLAPIIHFPDTGTQKQASQQPSQAFGRFFSDRAGVLRRHLNALFRVGRRPLGIGLPIPIACLALVHRAAGCWTENLFRRLVEESFLILGRVADPLEICPDDWRPLTRRRDPYRRLSRAAAKPKPCPMAAPGASRTGAR